MPDESRLPVLIGVGQLRNNPERTHDAAREPLELAEEAARRAVKDAGVDALLNSVDTITAVKTSSWAYDDLPSLLAGRLGISPTRTSTTTVGGHWPAAILDAAAAEIAAGASRAALLVGAEAQASVSALLKAGVDPGRDHGWTTAPGGPPAFDPDDLGSPAMQAAGLIMPTRVYPLFENRLRHALGQRPEEATAWSARLYAAFSEVASGNPAAWTPTPRTAEEISTVGPGNRMVCEPYPLAMNAMPHVDQAAAVLVTSVALAREHGVDEDRLVYVWGGAGASDSPDVLSRPDFARSAALESVLRRCLDRGGLDATELDVLDVYSCFPVVPKLVIRQLGLADDVVPTVTGGHSSFGGPLSSYSLHAVVSVVERLREGATVGLVHANGGYLTDQHAVLLGRGPHADGYVGEPEPVSTATREDVPALREPSDDAAEPAVVETATVEYGRDGTPSQAFLVARAQDGARLCGQTRPGDTASARVLSLASGSEVVGRRVRISQAGPDQGFLSVDTAD
jgi:acetyl-CoA C-acetyltransferase